MAEIGSMKKQNTCLQKITLCPGNGRIYILAAEQDMIRDKTREMGQDQMLKNFACHS